MEYQRSRSKILFNFFYVIFRRKRLIIAIFVAICFAVIFGTFLVTPTYKAITRIQVSMNPQQQLILFRDLATPGEGVSSANVINNLIEILRSQSMAIEVVEIFDLDEPKPIKGVRDKIKNAIVLVFRSPITLAQKVGLLKKAEKNYLAEAIEDLFDAEDISSGEETAIINLSIWHEDPKLASDIANTMAKLLMQRTKNMERSEAHTVYEFTQGQLKTAEESLRDAEMQLAKFKEQQSAASLDEEKSMKIQRLDQLESELSVISADLEEIRQETSDTDRVISSTVIENNPLIHQLATSLHNLKIELASMKEEFTENHPDIVRLRAQILETEKQLNEETNSTVEALTSKKGALLQEISLLEKEVAQIPQKEAELSMLSRNVQTQEERYTNLKTKLLELEVQRVKEMSQFDLQVIDEAHILEGAEPNRPSWLLNIVLGIFASLIISFGMAFFFEYWNDSFKTMDEVEEYLKLPVLGLIPDMRKKFLKKYSMRKN